VQPGCILWGFEIDQCNNYSEGVIPVVQGELNITALARSLFHRWDSSEYTVVGGGHAILSALVILAER